MRGMKQTAIQSKRYLLHMMCISLFFIFALLQTTPVYAAEKKEYKLSPNKYEVPEKNHFEIGEDYTIRSFSFGRNEVGSFSLTGAIDEATEYQDRPAYITNDKLELHYTYGGELHSDDIDKWNLYSAEAKKVEDISLNKNVLEGCLIIRKSSDGKKWKTAVEPVTNFLSKEKDNLIVYEVEEKDRIAGTFFQVILAYEVNKRMGEKADISIGDFDLPVDVPFLNNDKYKYLSCMQVYEFYVCSNENPIILRDVISGEDISSKATVSKGFQIDKRGSKADISISHDGETIDNVRSYDSFYLPGAYTVSVTTPLNKTYHLEMTVEEGLAFETLTPTVYENTKKNGYKKGKAVEGTPVSGIDSYSTLKLGYAGNETCTEGTYYNSKAYGITGDSVCFFLSLDQKTKMKEKGWKVTSDSWGKNKKEKIYGVSTGQVGTGAVVVQTSMDGQNWVNQENLGYAEGLFNTDFEKNYGTDRDVLLYTPSGKDVLDGVYIRIIYAYMIRGTENDKEYRCMEEYSFFLCSNELGAVTVHNLSTQEPMAEVLADKDNSEAELYISAEDMLSGSGTVTGFTIDNQLNKVAKYSVEKDGEPMNTIGGEKFDETGRYDITVTNCFGTEDVLSVYVDRLSTNKAYKLYFGDSFLDGKRIYSEGKYPVYEGGKVSYKLNAVSDSYLPIGGVITNLTTGSEIKIDASREERTNTLIEPGSYEAVLTNNPFDGEEEQSGDYRTFVFHFEIIEEGTAPGAIVNQRQLKEFNAKNISGCRQQAYALIYQSASKGNIALIFASEQEAYEYAVKYESGTVELQKDGSYRYTGSFLVNKKTEYNSNWDVNDAIDYFARLAVQNWYFDLSDEYTYLTLNEKILEDNENLRMLELDKSVAVYASDEDRAALAETDALPFINSLKYAYLKPGIDGDIQRGKNHFEFIKDKEGWDSSSVVIIDEKGNEYPIKYKQDVDEQLKEKECFPGIVTIQETTVYGDTVKYQAVYLPEDQNLSTVTVSYYVEGQEETETLTQKNDGWEITADAFSVKSVEDETDPYSLIKVTGGEQGTEYYTPETITEKEWVEPGTYQIKFINRLGYSYTLNVNVSSDVETDISFSGEGTEKLETFTVTFGDQNIQLPEIERYGYEFGGYRDNYGNTYSKEITQILYKGSLVLEAVWNPKPVKVILERPDGSIYQTEVIPFGSTYRLGAYISDNKQEHVNGWIYDGQLYTDTIQIDKEDDYVLRVSTESIVSEDEAKVENSEENSEEPKDEAVTISEDENKTETSSDEPEAAEKKDETKATEETKAMTQTDDNTSDSNSGTVVVFLAIAAALGGAVFGLKKRAGKGH